MAIKERSQIKGTKAQIDAFAGHEGVLGFATDTKHLHVFSGTAGTSTEYLPKEETATKQEVAQALAGQVNANWTETDTTSKAYIQNKPALKPVATSGSYNDLDNKPSPIQYVAQTLTTAQKTQARTNIDAVSESELKTALSELIVEYGGTVPTD